MRISYFALFLVAGSSAFCQTFVPALATPAAPAQNTPALPSTSNLTFSLSQMNPQQLQPPPVLAQNRPLLAISPAQGRQNFGPIPTQWPNAKFEPIPTKWPKVKVELVGSQPPKVVLQSAQPAPARPK